MKTVRWKQDNCIVKLVHDKLKMTWSFFLQTFCSLACEDLHRRLRSKSDSLGQHYCAVCNQLKAAREQISLQGQTHWLCSVPCRNAFRFVNKVGRPLLLLLTEFSLAVTRCTGLFATVGEEMIPWTNLWRIQLSDHKKGTLHIRVWNAGDDVGVLAVRPTVRLEGATALRAPAPRTWKGHGALRPALVLQFHVPYDASVTSALHRIMRLV